MPLPAAAGASRTCDLHYAIQLIHGRCAWEERLAAQQLPKYAACVLSIQLKRRAEVC